jgi:hypothetical protein
VAGADATPEGESTPSGDPVAQGTLFCLFCAVPIEPAKRGGERMFCSDRHRAAYHAKMQAQAITQAREAVLEAVGEMQRLTARLDGALQLLDRYGKKRKKGLDRLGG